MAGLRSWWRSQRPRLVSGILLAFVKIVGATLRVRMENWDTVESLTAPRIICGWHGRSFVAAARFRGLGYWVIISHSRDGEIQNHIFRGLGFNVIRGSTGRGGVRAAIEGIRQLKRGASMAITPDGPRGPSGIVQGGVLLMAQKSQAAMVPVGISARPRWRAKSWDRYLVPLPFARAVMRFGEPMFVPEESTEEELEQARCRLEAEIHRLQSEADREMGYSC